MTARPIRIRCSKYDGTRRWEMPTSLVRRRGTCIVTRTITDDWPGGRQRHWSMASDFQTFFWLDRWYNVVRYAEPVADGVLWYCNIATPAEFDGETLHFIDLDVDVVVREGWRWQLQDEDEFQRNAVLLAYPEDVIREARRAVDEIVGLVERRRFPFQRRSRTVSERV